MDAQQNVYNVGFDAAALFASVGVSLTGDTVTEKLSIGCDATSRTSPGGTDLLGPEGGLDLHNVSICSNLPQRSLFAILLAYQADINTLGRGWRWTPP